VVGLRQLSMGLQPRNLTKVYYKNVYFSHNTASELIP